MKLVALATSLFVAAVFAPIQGSQRGAGAPQRIAAPPATTPSSSIHTVRRSVMKTGIWLVEFSDGSKKEHRGNTVVVTYAGGQEAHKNASTAQSSAPPGMPADQLFAQWFERHERMVDSLLALTLSEEASSLANYRKSEETLGRFQRIDRRLDCIRFLTSGRESW